MRGVAILVGLCAVVAVPTAAGTRTSLPAHFVPVLRHGPRVRHGTIHLQPANPRVRVIASLPLPPLARRYGRGLASFGARRKLAVHSAAARAYLRKLASGQKRAATELHTQIPGARVQGRFRILLDALTVSVPYASLPRLLRLPQFKHVYPVLRYTLTDDTSTAVIGAPQVEQDLGIDGTGMKIGIVDDGIDQTNAFFDPTSFAYPAGFPKGDTAYTTAKVIVARAFPTGNEPFDSSYSFHGTHVAGIAAGDEGTTAPESDAHPSVTGLRGVAPKASLGNYRVFTNATALTPVVIAAFESAVADGMDVINFSAGVPEVQPSSDALIPVIENIARAGVVPVIAAGNEHAAYGDGTIRSPATAPSAITVAATSNTHVFAPSLAVQDPAFPPIYSAYPSSRRSLRFRRTGRAA